MGRISTGRWLLSLGLVCILPQSPAPADEPLPERVEFNRDIRPLFSDTCFQCHGPDARKRKADMRLDTTTAHQDLLGRRALVPGKPAESSLWVRLTSSDDAERMPPPDSGKTLTPRQIELVRRWIEQGGEWQGHWAFIAPQRREPPAVKNAAWPQNEIDRFVLARLEAAGLEPAPAADPVTLIRRVTLDLTGLPATPAEVDAFLADASPQAYERLVDRLLASPHYGEKMAGRWLDAARYADTNGYQTDGERFMWRWRDWVIDAYNRNLPFDQFTIEQLAGDLLPNPTIDQRIATGFNRNHRGNGEGGIIPEEFAVEYVVDRVETTFTVWMGLTVQCARCHDHKYDPLLQKEFYQAYAYFNQMIEKGKAVKYGNSPPLLKAPTTEQQVQLRAIDERIAQAESQFSGLAPQRAAEQSEWERSLSAAPPADWSLTEGLVSHFPLEGHITDAVPSAGAGAAGEPRTGKFMDGEPAYAAGRINQALDGDGKRFVAAGDIGDFGFYDKFSLSAWIRPTAERKGGIVSRQVDADKGDGYSVYLENGKILVNLVKRWLDDAIRIETGDVIPADAWTHVLVTYDGTRLYTGVKVYVNGVSAPHTALVDDLNQSFQTKEPLRIGAGGGPENRFKGLIDDVRVYNRALKPDEALIVATPEAIADLAALPSVRRSPAQASKLEHYFLEKHAPRPVQEAWKAVRAVRAEREKFVETLPTTMVMEDAPAPRETFVLVRGDYKQRGEQVSQGVPGCLPPLPADAPANRLGLARWLVSPEHPLTARVAVNRFWQMYFGAAIVKTVDDFGAQGEWPSHPELLDWLATDFIRTGWDIKQLQKMIVMSAAYRQSSRVTPALLQADPENRLLARGPRIRLAAQSIRDQALAASGLLVPKLGGPSVKPYQPAGLWKDLTDTEYVQDQGENLYRRSLYTYWKRTVAPPAMMTFDASPRETCTVRETRTNTPLQALTLMNEVTFVESARRLAQRTLHEAAASPDERLTHLFRLVLVRRPRPAELEILRADLDESLRRFRADVQAAQDFVSVGESPRDEKLDVAELAAYSAIAGLVLNLDETITKE